MTELVEEFRPLRGQLPQHVATEAMAYFRHQLPAQCVDHRDLESRQAQLISVAKLATSFEDVVPAFEAIEPNLSPENFGQKVDLLAHLVEGYEGLPLEELSVVRRRSPLSQATQDFTFILRNRRPGQTLGEGVEEILECHQALVEHFGYQGSREAYRRFQKSDQDDLGTYLASLRQVCRSLNRARSGVEIPQPPPSASLEVEETPTQRDLQAVLCHRLPDQGVVESAATLARFYETIGTRVDANQTRPLLGVFHARIERGHYQQPYSDAVEAFVTEQIACLDGLARAGHSGLSEDYACLLGHRTPGLTLREEARMLATLHTTLTGQESPGVVRGLYQRLSEEHQSGAFGERSLQETYSQLLAALVLTESKAKSFAIIRAGGDFLSENSEALEALLLSGDRASALEIVQAGQAQQTELRIEEDEIFIGDFRLEVEDW